MEQANKWWSGWWVVGAGWGITDGEGRVFGGGGGGGLSVLAASHFIHALRDSETTHRICYAVNPHARVTLPPSCTNNFVSEQYTGGGGATPRVLGRQLPLPPPPPLGAFSQQLDHRKRGKMESTTAMNVLRLPNPVSYQLNSSV